MPGLHECPHCHYRFEDPHSLADHEPYCSVEDRREPIRVADDDEDDDWWRAMAP